jgi:CBS domain-containing protein
MLVRDRMCKNPVTVTRQDTLATTYEKMITGQSHHLPVLHDNHVVGILIDRALRHHIRTAARTPGRDGDDGNPLTIYPLSTVENAFINLPVLRLSSSAHRGSFSFCIHKSAFAKGSEYEHSDRG